MYFARNFRCVLDHAVLSHLFFVLVGSLQGIAICLDRLCICVNWMSTTRAASGAHLHVFEGVLHKSKGVCYRSHVLHPGFSSHGFAHPSTP